MHGPVGVGRGVAGGAGGVVAQGHREEECHTERDGGPVHPRLRATRWGNRKRKIRVYCRVLLSATLGIM